MYNIILNKDKITFKEIEQAIYKIFCMQVKV